ncbi:hypothetical protein [Puniceibacterium sp. IMCC21224]|uniref:hypothetical protein n=1 Tax=Puniceibacterium sp. IMCC21224 TaxID=1618204 RepID=UPI00065CC8C3|nr:hypothetical protein [Puniceibacterium sp. IMCC21224]KMK67629.1 hypothetical protein IMCC21224_112501 [Puniceibacterium sp. IMCC21224]
MSVAPILISALLTGVFCAGFAAVVSTFTGMLGLGTVMLVSFASGFSGSLFAQFVMRER